MPSRLPLLLCLCAVLAAWALPAAPPKAVGVAISDMPFLIEDSEVRGNATILEDEGVSTSYLPTRVRLNDGSEFMLGIGSYAQWNESLIRLEGVSLELTNVGSAPPVVEAGGLYLKWTDPETRARFYTDRADILTVRVESGAVEVERPTGETLRTVKAGEAVTFSKTRTDLQVQVNRAPIEIARVQMRQLDYQEALEETLPSIRSHRRKLLIGLSTASAGLLSLNPALRENAAPGLAVGSGALTVNPQQLLAATDATNTEVNSTPSHYGCGNATCGQVTRLSSLNIYVGYVVGLNLPYPGCPLCVPGALGGLVF